MPDLIAPRRIESSRTQIRRNRALGLRDSITMYAPGPHQPSLTHRRSSSITVDVVSKQAQRLRHPPAAVASTSLLMNTVHRSHHIASRLDLRWRDFHA
jgi:hypothetical protein